MYRSTLAIFLVALSAAGSLLTAFWRVSPQAALPHAALPTAAGPREEGLAGPAAPSDLQQDVVLLAHTVQQQQHLRGGPGGVGGSGQQGLHGEHEQAEQTRGAPADRPAAQQAPCMTNMTSSRLEDLERLFSVGSKTSRLPCAHGLTCVGADRMRSKQHVYGPCYAQWLSEVAPSWCASSSPLLVGEVGILTGSGLAVWSEIFGPHVEVHGFDFHLNNTRQNLPFLRSRGAFRTGDPALHLYDQLADASANAAALHRLLGDARFHFVMDDGLHTDEAIIDTFLAFEGAMHEHGLYVIEDVGSPGIRNCEASNATARACRERGLARFGGVASRRGWDIRTCDSDGRLFALTRTAR